MKRNNLFKIVLLIVAVLSAVVTVIICRMSEFDGYDGTYVCSETGESLIIIQQKSVIAVFKEDYDTGKVYGDMYFYEENAQNGTEIYESGGGGTVSGYCVIGDGIFVFMPDWFNRYGRAYIYEAVDGDGFRKAGGIIFPVLLTLSGILLLCSCIRRSQRGWFVTSAIIYAALAVVTITESIDSGVSGMYRSGEVADYEGTYEKIDMCAIDGDNYISALIGYNEWEEYALVNYRKDDENNIEYIVNNDDLSQVLYKTDMFLNSDLAISSNCISMLVSANNGDSQIIDFNKQQSVLDYIKWIVVLPAVLLPVGIIGLISRKKSAKTADGAEVKQAVHTGREIVYRITGIEYVCDEMDYMRSYLENNQVGTKVITNRTGLVFNGNMTAYSHNSGSYMDAAMREYIIKEDEDGTRLFICDGDLKLFVYSIERDTDER